MHDRPWCSSKADIDPSTWRAVNGSINDVASSNTSACGSAITSMLVHYQHWVSPQPKLSTPRVFDLLRTLNA